MKKYIIPFKNTTQPITTAPITPSPPVPLSIFTKTEPMSSAIKGATPLSFLCKGLCDVSIKKKERNDPNTQYTITY